MSNQTAKAFETFSGTLEERGYTLAKLEKDRVTSLEKANTKDVVFNGLAYQLGKLIHELTLESDSGRITSDRLQATSMNKVASQRRSEALQLYRNFDAIQEWLKGRVVKKRKQQIAFTSLTAMLKAFKFETQPKVEKTDTKVSEDTSTKVDEKPNVGTTQPKVEPTDTKVSDTKPTELKVQKVKVPQNSKEFAKYVFETTIKLGFDTDEVLEHIFNMFDEASSSKTGTDG
tara:strand:- start:760 stop:1449 length:690 start_codon:yes stop_codon:yes gene_type:complete